MDQRFLMDKNIY